MDAEICCRYRTARAVPLLFGGESRWHWSVTPRLRGSWVVGQDGRIGAADGTAGVFVNVFDVLHHPGQTHGTSNLSQSS